MSGDRLRLLGSYGGGSVDPEPVEMMEDDDSSTSNDSDIDEMKSENSDTTKQDSNDVNDDAVFGSMPVRSIFNDTNNNNTGLVSSNGHPEIVDTHKLTSYPDEELSEEDQERKRFQIELEFVQSLANPNYLNFLAQRGYFRNQTFLNYLKYLSYWKKPEYVKYIMYPQCLSLLELLQHETFQKEIVNAQCSKYIDEQLLLIWLHYKKRRDWIRVDPTKVPCGIEKLFSNVEESIIKNTKKIVEGNLLLGEGAAKDGSEESALLDGDTFGADAFLANEKL